MRDTSVKDLELGLDPARTSPGKVITGSISVGYPGNYDGVVINAQISDSSELVSYRSCNGSPLSQKVTRLFVPREEIQDGQISFEAVVDFVPSGEHDIKFRASIIEQHKEIHSAIAFVKYSG